MLESMITSPSRPAPRRATSPTRSSTAPRRSCSPGRRPSASTRSRASKFMDRIARAVEPSLAYRHELAQAADQPFPTVGEAMSNAACDIAEVLGAAAILVPTYSGRTASAVARHRPRRPVIAVTHKRQAVQQLAIEWGVVAGRDRGVPRRRGPLVARARGGARDGHRRRRRPRRHHRRHGRERPGHHEPDQGRDGLGGSGSSDVPCSLIQPREGGRGLRSKVARPWPLGIPADPRAVRRSGRRAASGGRHTRFA